MRITYGRPTLRRVKVDFVLELLLTFYVVISVGRDFLAFLINLHLASLCRLDYSLFSFLILRLATTVKLRKPFRLPKKHNFK